VGRFLRIGAVLTVIRLWGKSAGRSDKRCNLRAVSQPRTDSSIGAISSSIRAPSSA
jgi:hypothetical protein